MAAYTPIARYLISESSGTTLADNTGNGNALTITPNSNGSFTSNGAGNGYNLTAAHPTASAALLRGAANLGNFGSALSGATEASAIIACEVDTASGQVFFIGSLSGAGVFRLTFEDAYSCMVAWADEDAGGTTQYNRVRFTDVDLVVGLCVYAIVVDTTQVADADRIKMWRNNTQLTFDSIVNLPQNTALPTFGSSHYITLGNRPDNNMNVDGRFYYAEFGAGQLTPTQIGNAYTALLANNDANWAAADTTAPVLTSATGTATGATTATVGATTDEANGTMYCVVTTSATQPSVAQIKAGQNHTGAAASYASSQSITTTGAKTFNATGLTASTTYYAHMVHTDAASNDSNRISSSSFTTSAGSTSTPRFVHHRKTQGLM